VCGTAHITEAQVEHLCQTKGFTAGAFERCEACRRQEAATTFSTIVKW
jgi:hypothetical protein